MTSAELERALQAYLSTPHYQPQDASALARGLELGSKDRPLLREILKAWEEEGKLVRLRQARYKLRKAAAEALLGRIRTLPKGKQLFIPNEAGQLALRHLTQEGGLIELPVQRFRNLGAMDGDTVRATVRLNAPTAYRRRHRGMRPTAQELRMEARVEEIIRRRQGSWVGIYRTGGRYGYLRGDGRTSPELVRLTEAVPPELMPGMCISVQALRYPQGNMEATGRVTEVLGWPQDEGVDMQAVIRRHGLRTDFPAEVLAEASALPAEIPAEEYERREDWRSRCVFTIDPATARDYDDAICVEVCEDGWELSVHIADVSFYVRPGSALDREARLRGNSTYLPDRVLPMLPPRLCDDLCSLREGVDRLTRVCSMRINRQGKIVKTRYRDAIICSCRRMSYEQALSVLKGEGSSGDLRVDAMLQEANKLATLLRSRRFEAGALDLEMPEVRVVLDEHGTPTGVETTASDEAHALIEEFMLAANEQVARELKARMVPAIYRVHEEPDPGKLHEFALIVRSYGFNAGTLATRDELKRVMQHFRGHPDELLLKISLLRSMMRARYSPRALGHYGLAKGDYCHFTSPIRRYADLIIHRGFSRLTGQQSTPPALPSASRLTDIADHISETERCSAAAEQEAEHQKLIQLMQLQCEAEHPIIWQALITTAWPQGLAVEIPEIQMRGFVSAADLPQDTGHWFYERHANRWSNTSGESLLPGHYLPVIPIKVDPQTGFLDLKPAILQA